MAAGFLLSLGIKSGMDITPCDVLASLLDSGSSASLSDSEVPPPGEPSSDSQCNPVVDPEHDPEPLLEPEGDHVPLQDVCESELELEQVLELDSLLDALELD